MNMNCRSVWHAGGTYAPLLVKRGGLPAGIRHRRATGVVPLRATGGAVEKAKPLVKPASHPFGGLNGTQWHGCPQSSIRGQRRAR